MLTILLSVIVGLVVGGGCMAFVAARRIGEEAARQFDRGLVEGRWLGGTSGQSADEAARRRRVTALA